MADKHFVFAVAKVATELGETAIIRKRVSRALDWSSAIDRWDRLDQQRTGTGLKLRSVPVAFLAVRASNDPAWPSRGRTDCKPRDARTGRFV